MRINKQPKERHAELKWYEVEKMILGLPVDDSVKVLLFAVKVHTNSHNGWAWTSQKTLATEIRRSESAVYRAFATLRTLGLLEVERMRAGRHRYNQFNRYRINVAKLQQLSKANASTLQECSVLESKQPSSMQVAQQRAPCVGATSTLHLCNEHPAPAQDKYSIESSKESSNTLAAPAGLQVSYPLPGQMKETGPFLLGGFEEFYQAYPRKIAKAQAVKAWNRIRDVPAATIMAGLEHAKAEWSKSQTERKFIPFPATWLNGRRWEDIPDLMSDKYEPARLEPDF